MSPAAERVSFPNADSRALTARCAEPLSLVGAWSVLGRCLVGAWSVPGRCLVGAWSVGQRHFQQGITDDLKYHDDKTGGISQLKSPVVFLLPLGDEFLNGKPGEKGFPLGEQEGVPKPETPEPPPPEEGKGD